MSDSDKQPIGAGLRKTTVVVANARPEETVTVTEDEVRRVVKAIQVSEMGIYLTFTADQTGNGPDADDCCCEDGIVSGIFDPIPTKPKPGG
jgi:hypothetical protein